MSHTPHPSAPIPVPETRRARVGWTAVVCGMASYVDGAVLAGWTTILVIYQGAIGLTALDVGLIAGVLTFGVAVGAVVGGRLGDILGRRAVFVATMVVIVLVTVAMMFITSVPVMIVCAAAIGLAVGADLPVATATIAETADDRSRGTLLGLTQIFWFVGSIVPAVLAVAVGDLGRPGATIMLGHVAVVAALVLVARMTIPESAAWRLARAERRAGVRTVRADHAGFRDLLRAPYLAPFIALIVFYGLGMGYYTMYGQFSSYLLVNIAGFTVSQASGLVLFALPAGLLGALLFLKAVRGPRRFLYFTIGAIAMVVATALPVLFGLNLWTIFSGMALMSFFASFCGEAIMKVWTQQSFPTLTRATAQGSIMSAGRIVSALFGVGVPVLAAANLQLLLTVAFGCAVVSGAVAWAVFRTRDAHNEFDTEQQLEDVAPAVPAASPRAL